jgi:hypothetical protein
MAKKAAGKKAPKKAAKKAGKVGVKSTVKKRSLNAAPGGNTVGDPFNDQDKKRRLGNFTTAGEHARVGGRTSGIVGQTKKTFRTDNRKSAKGTKG